MGNHVLSSHHTRIYGCNILGVSRTKTDLAERAAMPQLYTKEACVAIVHVALDYLGVSLFYLVPVFRVILVMLQTTAPLFLTPYTLLSYDALGQCFTAMTLTAAAAGRRGRSCAVGRDIWCWTYRWRGLGECGRTRPEHPEPSEYSPEYGFFSTGPGDEHFVL